MRFSLCQYYSALLICLTISLCAGMPGAAGTVSLELPPSYNSVANMPFLSPSEDMGILEMGVSGTGDTNVATLWTYDDQLTIPQTFTPSTASASLAYGTWMNVKYRRWMVSIGNGQRDEYWGNHDAGQVWMNLHTDNSTTGNYQPVLTEKKLAVSWVGLGYDIPFKFGDTQGTCTAQLRHLSASDLFLGGARGEITGDDFSGMLRAISSETGTDGTGWSTDLSLTATSNTHWQYSVRAEGLFSSLTWPRVHIADMYVTSPYISGDPDGFIHSFWGASGMDWHDRFTLDIDPRFSAQITYRNQQEFTAETGVIGEEVIPSLGVAWPQPGGWKPYITYAPTAVRYSLGLQSRYGVISVTSDRWPNEARYLIISLSTTPFTF